MRNRFTQSSRSSGRGLSLNRWSCPMPWIATCRPSATPRSALWPAQPVDQMKSSVAYAASVASGSTKA